MSKYPDLEYETVIHIQKFFLNPSSSDMGKLNNSLFFELLEAGSPEKQLENVISCVKSSQYFSEGLIFFIPYKIGENFNFITVGNRGDVTFPSLLEMNKGYVVFPFNFKIIESFGKNPLITQRKYELEQGDKSFFFKYRGGKNQGETIYSAFTDRFVRNLGFYELSEEYGGFITYTLVKFDFTESKVDNDPVYAEVGKGVRTDEHEYNVAGINVDENDYELVTEETNGDEPNQQEEEQQKSSLVNKIQKILLGNRRIFGKSTITRCKKNNNMNKSNKLVKNVNKILEGYNLETLTNFHSFLTQECSDKTNPINTNIFRALYNANSIGGSSNLTAVLYGGARKRSLKRNRNLKRSTHKRSRQKRSTQKRSTQKRSRKATRKNRK